MKPVDIKPPGILTLVKKLMIMMMLYLRLCLQKAMFANDMKFL